MIKIKDFLKKRIELKLIPSFIIMIAGSLAIMFAAISINETFAPIIKNYMSETPLLFLLNYIPIILTILLLFFIFNKAVFSTISAGCFFLLLEFVNNEKILLRQDPLFPTDLTLFTELVGIAKNFTPRTLIFYIMLLVFAAFVIMVSFIFFKTKKINPKIRAGGAVLVLAVFMLCNNFLYKSEQIYNSFNVYENPYFEVNQYGSKGFLYSFIHKFNTMQVTPPDGYNQAELIEAENSYDYKTDEYKNSEKPHIIMIMGEAFSDLSENSHLNFENYRDPLENWKKLSQSENALSGHIIVPNYGGGTSNTEFDVLTALPTRYTGNSSTSYSLIRKEMDALPWRLREIGYNTMAIHPGYSWFYNRANVYRYLGFENFIHLESFQGSEKYRGGYIADKYASDSIIENFENHISSSDAPIFEFCVTIQNHGPYDEKYNEVIKTFDTDIELSESEETLLNSYFMGIIDADKEIGRLTDYFSQTDEPVVLVYFGDHLPGFSNGMDFFDILDYNIDANGAPEQILNIYKTPFIIWENNAAKEISDFSLVKDTLELPYNNTISSNYLGTTMLEIMGINGISPLYDFENSLRKSLPVITTSNFMNSSGEYTSYLTAEEQNKIAELKNWVYYKMFDN
ncbi:LTA synthase family protein [Anaerotignum faecicola]|nr:LTA synthase family protein [Anaerotignum faecicola]